VRLPRTLLNVWLIPRLPEQTHIVDMLGFIHYVGWK
jgi:hypothetical protein